MMAVAAALITPLLAAFAAVVAVSVFYGMARK